MHFAAEVKLRSLSKCCHNRLRRYIGVSSLFLPRRPSILILTQKNPAGSGYSKGPRKLPDPERPPQPGSYPCFCVSQISLPFVVALFQRLFQFNHSRCSQSHLRARKMQGLHRLHLQNVHSQQQGSLCCGHNTILILHSSHVFFAASVSPFYPFNTMLLSFRAALCVAVSQPCWGYYCRCCSSSNNLEYFDRSVNEWRARLE
jgi:hypothetical protein